MINFENLSLSSSFVSVLIFGVALFVVFSFKARLSLRIIRGLLLLFVCLLILAPSWQITLNNEDVILIDVSGSMESRLRQNLIAKAKALSPNAKIVEFADFIQTKTTSNELKRDRTNIESALHQVARQSRNILLVSDGFQNKGSVLRELSKGDMPKIFPLVEYDASKQKGSCDIKEFESPLTAPAQSAVDIRTIVGNDTSSLCRGRLEVRQDTKVLLSDFIALEKGETKVISTKSDPSLDGKRRISATFIPENSNATKQRNRFLTTSKREKILMMNGTSLDARILSPLLRQQSYQIDEYFGDQGTIPKLKFEEYGTIILNNISLKQLESEFPQMLHDYVQNGGNILVFGGERSFGLGGYRDSALEKALPVFSLPPQTEQKRLNAAVQLVIDKSKSMEQQSRLDFVKAAAKEVITSLKPDDYLGLVAFDNEPFVVIAINRIEQIRQQALSLVDRFFPSGSTRLLKALQLAGQSLERVPAGRKHIIVLTDGRLPDAGPMYVELVKQLRISGMTVSSVLISDEEGSYPLKEMAEVGGGVFYVTNDPSSLPRIFLQDIRVSTGERTVKESVQYDIKRGPAGIQSTTLQSFPRLKGFVLTKAKDDAKVELLIAEGNTNPEPLLVSWNYGQGRAVAFTSDLYGRWSDEWAKWSSLSQFVVDLMTRKDKPNTQNSALDFDVRTYLEGSQLTVELFIYNQIGDGKVEGNLDELPLELKKKAEGRYEAQIDLDQFKESYDLNFTVNQSKLPTITFALSEDSLTEKVGLGMNLPLLSQIASLSNGQINPDSLPTSEKEKTKNIPLEPIIYPLLALLLLLEVFLREHGSFSSFKSQWGRR